MAKYVIVLKDETVEEAIKNHDGLYSTKKQARDDASKRLELGDYKIVDVTDKNYCPRCGKGVTKG